jgi:hypothetical protein
MKNQLLTLTAILVLALAACKKEPNTVPDPNPNPSGTSSIRLSFSNKVGNDSLILGGPYHWVNANGDSFYVNSYKYYISNIRFTDNNGNTWSESESYHLIDASNQASCSFLVSGIPVGNYTSVQYMIGVDSARNVSGAQTGALDPANNMFWTWSTGYIMAKLEGKSNMSTASSNNITFHIAGYQGANATQRIVSPAFGSFTANATESTIPVIHIKSDVLEWFVNPSLVRFNITNYIMSTGANSTMMADNYSDMFTVTGIDN